MVPDIDRVVHEIRNPLNAIVMLVAVIRRKLADPNPANIALARDQLERIEREVRRLEALAEEMLNRPGDPPDHPERIELLSVIHDVVELLRPEFSAVGVNVSIESSPDSGALAVTMDRAKLEQVLLNLVKNSLEAMERGGSITLRVRNRLGTQAIVQCIDNGCGIDAEMLPHVGTRAYSSKEDGNGLGLCIVKEIVDEAGGSFGVESDRGAGTCVTLALPLAGSARDPLVTTGSVADA
jgi:two-component system sporulation sensor kinase A